MQLCYVDESGTAETLVISDPQQQPVIVIAGVTLPEQRLTAITHDWIELKKLYYPSVRAKGHGWLDAILHDIKGSSLRHGFRGGTPKQRKHAIGLIGGTLTLLEKHGGKLTGRIWVKELNATHKDMSLHGASLQFICSAFHAAIAPAERGMVVVDSQTYQHNHRLAHSMFTQRFGRDPKHPRLVDMPVFGHSDNHAGLQIADFLCSAVLAPIACAVYAGAYSSWNVHCQSAFLDIRELFGQRLEALVFRWQDDARKSCPSVQVSDPIGKRGVELMWGPVSATTPTRQIRVVTTPSQAG
jgi:hypothetical protein